MERLDRYLTWWDRSIVWVVFSAALFVFSRTLADPDLWGHIKFGQDFWQTGKIIQSDSYSYLTGDQVWINHEWLSEAVFSLAFSVAGSPGLILLKAAIGLLITALGYRHLSQQGLGSSQAGILLMLTAFLLMPWLLTARPQAFTYLFFLAMLLIIHEAERGYIRWLWLAPPLFVLWVNLHGGFLAGMGIFLLWSLGHFVSVILSARRPNILLSPPNPAIILALIASALATSVNPYGLKLLLFLLRTATVPRPEIVEWRPITLFSMQGGEYLILLAVAITGLVSSRRQRSPALILVFGCVALLPLIAVRHTPLFVLATIVLAGHHIGDFWQRRFPRCRASTSHNGARQFGPWLATLNFAGAVLLIGWSLPNFGCIQMIESPARAIALLEESGATGNLAIDFGWGEYALWHLAPRVKVSMDGRRETVYSDKIYKENMQFMRGIADWDSLLRKYETQIALVSKKFPVFNLMKLQPGWLLIYEDPLTGLFVQKGSPLVEQIRGTNPPRLPHNGRGLCFP